MENIPKQHVGKSLDYNRQIICTSEDEAIGKFKQITKDLLNVNDWKSLAHGISGEFKILNSDGAVVERGLVENDFIRIDIPGPGMPSAEGYDWVQVSKLIEEQDVGYEKLLLTIHPIPSPLNNLNDVAHFFKEYASSSFLIERRMNQISLHYAGRNEEINIENSKLLDNVRNIVVGLMAKLGASYPQWKAIIDGLADSSQNKDKST